MRVLETAGLGDLGVTEYWVMDEEGGVDPLIKSRCTPFMVAPGYRIQVPGPFSRPKDMPIQYGPAASGLSGRVGRTFSGNLHRLRIPTKAQLFGLGDLGYYEVLAPTGMPMAAFRCLPYYVEGDLTVKQIMGGQEVLIQRGAAELPEGTVRERRGALFTVRRG